MKVCNIKAKVTIHSWENMKKKKKISITSYSKRRKERKKKKSYIDCIYIL